MNYCKKNLQKTEFTKPSFSVNELLEDVRNLSKFQSVEVRKIYSNLVTYIAHFSQSTVDPRAEEFERSFRLQYDMALRWMDSLGLDRNIYDEANIHFNNLFSGNQMLVGYNQWMARGRSENSYTSVVNAMGYYTALFFALSFYTKNDSSLTPGISANLSRVVDKANSLKASLGNMFERTLKKFEEIIASRVFGINPSTVLTKMGLKKGVREYTLLKSTLAPKLEQFLISLYPDFLEYTSLVSRYRNNLDLFFPKFNKLYQDVVRRLEEGYSPTPQDEYEQLSNPVSSSLKNRIFAQRTEEYDFSDDMGSLDNIEDLEGDTENVIPEDGENENRDFQVPEEVLEKFVKDFDPTGESLVMLEFMGQSEIDAAQSDSDLKYKKNSKQHASKTSDIIVEDLRKHQGNSFSKLALAVTIYFQLSH